MPIGVVSDEDFNTEVDRSERNPVPELKPAQVLDIPRPGRSEGDENVPDSLRALIADDKLHNGRRSALQFANMVGVSPSSVSAYSNGATSTSSYNNPNSKLTSALKQSKERIAKKASKILNKTFENITEDKLMEAKLTDLALVAKTMSGIIKDMEPPSEREGGMHINGPSIVMYNPGFAKESSFETVTLEENQ
jgi:predicted transcriptional regulator